MKGCPADRLESQWPFLGKGRGEKGGGERKGRERKGRGEERAGRGGSDSQLLRSFTELREADRGQQSHTGCCIL